MSEEFVLNESGRLLASSSKNSFVIHGVFAPAKPDLQTVEKLIIP
jgi:hypothetical protein